jgi:hypothetical protein
MRRCRKGTREKGERKANRRERSERLSLLPYLAAFLTVTFSLEGAGVLPELADDARAAAERANSMSLLARVFGTPRTSAERSGVAKGLVMR